MKMTKIIEKSGKFGHVKWMLWEFLLIQFQIYFHGTFVSLFFPLLFRIDIYQIAFDSEKVLILGL